MKIAFFEIKPEEKTFFESNLSNHELFFSPDTINLNTLPHKDFEIISSHTNSKIDKTIIENLPNLKLIATRTTGYDHIDCTSAAAHNIIVCNIPAYGEITVAEYTFALLLSLSRKIPLAYNRVRAGEFHSEGLDGFDLYDKTLGVVGTGRIGTNVIRIANGFRMKILAYDAYPNPKLAEEYKFSYVPFDQILTSSDIITFHVPSLAETTHMINAETVKKLKPGVVILNTSRGSVLDTSILLPALENQTISAMALDVIEDEQDLQDHPEKLLNNQLINHPNVFVTPHNAFNTKEALQRILETTVENITNFSTSNPSNVVKIKA